MKFTVIGAGHGGQAMAGYISLLGYETTLYNRTASVIESIKDNKGIELCDYINGKAENVSLTSNLSEALKDTNVIMISIPANAHKNLALNIAPYIKDNHIIVINPGRTLGAYYFKKHLKEFGCIASPIIAETDTFMLTSRKIRDGLSAIMSLKKEIYVAADTSENTRKVCDILSKPFSMVRDAESYVYTSFANIGSIFHPLPAIFNIGRIENRDKYLHYKEGITPSICNLMEKLDCERVALAKELGVEVPDAKKWLENVYSSSGKDLYETLQNTTAYNGVLAPTEISTRYIYEDITTGIVPMYCIAKQINSPHHILGLIIELATEVFEYDFVKQGRFDVKDFVDELKLYNKEKIN
ncbi:NAD/NADP octopine/nopaline dehydrogenase family protein [Clostridium sulfidigenes]|uniref:NAD/NADP octopine/nopaline dehydrogenase family protein n=1 Tax=Clostridium sulfidigenes TaxID=318464 RepID=UPI003F889593